MLVGSVNFVERGKHGSMSCDGYSICFMFDM